MNVTLNLNGVTHMETTILFPPENPRNDPERVPNAPPWPSPEDDTRLMLDKIRMHAQHQQNWDSLTIYPAPRVPEDAPEYKYPGWLEWQLRYEYKGGGGMTVGLIQRKPGEIVESHT